jgi:DNA repair protein RadC
MIVDTARSAADLLAPIFVGAEGEKLAVLHLDPARTLIALDEHDLGGGDEMVLPLREIFAAALRHGSVGLVVAHNHPSGDPRPSRADKAAARRLAETADALAIVLHDHLIFAGGECLSFRRLGLL